LPVYASLHYTFAFLKGSSLQYVAALASAAMEGLSKKIGRINETVAFVAAFLDPKIRIKLNDICAKVPVFSLDKVGQLFRRG
jgi:hypothetical protein